MKKMIASAAVMLVVSVAAFAAPIYAGTAKWYSNIESPITACERQFPGSGPSYLSVAKPGTPGTFTCYKY